MSLTATYDPVLGRIRLAGTALGVTADHALVWRSTDNFATFTPVRGANPVAVTGQLANVDDYEFEPGVPLTYQMTSYDAAGVQQASFTVGITQDLTEVWLKVPAAPFLNTTVTVVDHGEVTRRSRAGVFDVVGRPLPVSVGDVASSQAFTLYLLTQNGAAERNLDFLFASGEVVFLQLPSTVDYFPGGYYSVGSVSRVPTMRLSPRRVWTVPLTEVAEPGPAVVGSSYTWGSVVADYATWGDLIADNATWGDLLQRTGTPSDVIVP